MPLVVLVGEYSKESPEQITFVNGLIWAVGFRLIVKLNGLPSQKSEIGLVYEYLGVARIVAVTN